ncbi:uncharacterized protein [Leptinotarsa decemlineata]|uniref:uncharacterized protein n=1 Tax=Leptinotarsa decemlineata TaxID=7539 RepID=UPI003D309383
MKVLYFLTKDMFKYLIIIFVCNVFSAHSVSNVTIDKAFENITAENELWLGLVKNCQKPTFSCIKNSIYDYLKNTLDYKNDVQFTSFMKFTKNALDYTKSSSKAIDSYNDTEERSSENETPFEEVSRSLTEDTKHFLMTHDLEVQLPDTFFLGSTLKISPRSLDTSGTIVKLELIPRKLDNSVGEGRIFFNKIKKFISERLLFALLAILLVIKLLAVKILFVLPAIIGVAAAKKLILKVLLFLFPALHHLFKLCAYTPYGAKHHIHKHQISHVHQIGHKHHPSYGHGGYVEVAAPHFEGLPNSHYFDRKKYNDPYGEPDLYPKNEFISHRNDPETEENEVNPWVQGQTTRRPQSVRPPTPTEIENIVLKAEKEALIKSRLQKEKQRIHEENLRLQEQLNNALKIQEKLKQHTRYIGKIPSSTKTYSFLSPPLARPSPTPPEFPQTSFAEPPSNPVGVGLPIQTVKAVQDFVNYRTPQNLQQSQVQPIYHHSKLQENAVQNQETPSKQTEIMKSPSFDTRQGFEPSKSIGISKLFQTAKPTVTFQYPDDLEHFETVDAADSTKFEQTFKLTPTFEKPEKHGYEDEIYKAASITYDKFYSPILEKVDKILNELEFFEEPCRERLICSMYKYPDKFSPHSNLISAELSRDSEELQKPTSTNAAVIRFYRYVQAARDGQDKRDCIRLYPSCVINTES